MSTTGKAPRRYPFRGGTITAKEAADRFGISIKSMYNRLAKCGDDMEAACSYYENRIGGGNTDMKKLSMKEERAVNELAEMLCGARSEDEGRRIPKETIAAAPQGHAAVKEIDVETGVARLLDEPAEVPQPEEILPEGNAGPAMELEQIRPAEKDGDRRLLGLYNAAIEALNALNEEIEDLNVGQNADALLDQLRQLRINTFEHLVPWDALAKG